MREMVDQVQFGLKSGIAEQKDFDLPLEDSQKDRSGSVAASPRRFLLENGSLALGRALCSSRSGRGLWHRQHLQNRDPTLVSLQPDRQPALPFLEVSAFDAEFTLYLHGVSFRTDYPPSLASLAHIQRCSNSIHFTSSPDSWCPSQLPLPTFPLRQPSSSKSR